MDLPRSITWRLPVKLTQTAWRSSAGARAALWAQPPPAGQTTISTLWRYGRPGANLASAMILLLGPESGQVFVDYHDGEEELFVRPMDHTFSAFTDEKTVDELINAAGDYVSAHFD
nr:hypothetical protein [Flavimaribacter sediminis]